MASTTKTLPFADPSIKWYVRPSLNHTKIITSNAPAADSINYSCDDVICFPRYYRGYLSWYDPSTDSFGSRMFDRPEAWDHERRTNHYTTYPYNGGADLIPGYGGYFLAVHLSDGSNLVQVNIIRRYLDDTILIYNTGKYGGSSYNIPVIVNNPPGNYNVQTNGTLGTGTTTLASGQYIMFYKDTAPTVNAATGLFLTSPFGVGKSQPYELWTNAFTYTGNNINVPKMYLGVKAPTDMEVISNGAYPGTYFGRIYSGESWNHDYPLYGPGGHYPLSYNVSSVRGAFHPHPIIFQGDPNVSGLRVGNMLFNTWFGWGEDESNNVKFILLSLFSISIDTNFKETRRNYVAYIYDVERNEAYTTYIIKPTIDLVSQGEQARTFDPLFPQLTNRCSGNERGVTWIDANDAWYWSDRWDNNTPTYYDNAYGFCNFYNDKIICAEGLGIYTTDTSYVPPSPKSAFGAVKVRDRRDAIAIRVPSLGDRTLKAGKIYAVITRLKTFPTTTGDADLQSWLKSLQPISLRDSDFDHILNILPGSFWLFGENADTVNVSVPSAINPGSQFTVNVSCPTRPNTPVWIGMVDIMGKIVASNNGTTDDDGNAAINLTAPSTPDSYRIIAIVKGTRQLI